MQRLLPSARRIAPRLVATWHMLKPVLLVLYLILEVVTTIGSIPSALAALGHLIGL